MSLAVAHVDGASSGNPGEAGIGIYLEYDGLIHEISIYLGVATNNVAEYRSLIAALQRALLLGAKEIKVYMDSELAVRQMTGRYKVKNQNLLELYNTARSLAAKFDRFEIAHVRRGMNKNADALARKATKTKEDDTITRMAKEAKDTGSTPEPSSSEPPPDRLF